MNKIVNDNDEELTHIWQKLEDQESVVDKYWQQIKVLQKQKLKNEDHHHLVWKKLEIMESDFMTTNREVRSQFKMLSKRQWKVTIFEYEIGSID